MSVPEAPVNVKLKRKDGELITLENVWRRQDTDGVNVWVPVHPVTGMAGDQIVADKMPDNTRVQLPDGAH